MQAIFSLFSFSLLLVYFISFKNPRECSSAFPSDFFWRRTGRKLIFFKLPRRKLIFYFGSGRRRSPPNCFHENSFITWRIPTTSGAIFILPIISVATSAAEDTFRFRGKKFSNFWIKISFARFKSFCIFHNTRKVSYVHIIFFCIKYSSFPPRSRYSTV